MVAIGSPQGLTGTVTNGIISAFNRTVAVQGEDGSAVVYNGLQTDAPINPGNSGGPLVNLDGQVVGINSAIATSSGTQGQGGSIGLGFAIPIDQATRVAQEIMQNGTATKPVLGVTGNVSPHRRRREWRRRADRPGPGGLARPAGRAGRGRRRHQGRRAPRSRTSPTSSPASAPTRPGSQVALTVQSGGAHEDRAGHAGHPARQGGHHRQRRREPEPVRRPRRQLNPHPRGSQGHLPPTESREVPLLPLGGANYASSRIVALAWPPPSHIVCRP